MNPEPVRGSLKLPWSNGIFHTRYCLRNLIEPGAIGGSTKSEMGGTQTVNQRMNRIRQHLHRKLSTKLELFGDRNVAIGVGIVQVIKQPATLTHHHQQTATRTVVLDILLQMLGQIIDALR